MSHLFAAIFLLEWFILKRDENNNVSMYIVLSLFSLVPQKCSGIIELGTASHPFDTSRGALSSWPQKVMMPDSS